MHLYLAQYTWGKKTYIGLLINGDALLIHSLISVKLWPCCTKLKQGNKLVERDHNLTKMGELIN